MQELYVWGVGGPDDDFTDQNRGIIRSPASPRTLAAVRDPSLDYIHSKVPTEKRAASPPYIMSPEDRRAHDEQQAELVRRLELGLPSPEYVPELGDNGTETWPNDIRIYTRAKAGQLKFWGVIDDDETMEEFWAKHDPEDTRLQEPAEEVKSRGASNQVVKAPEATPHEKSPVRRRQSKRASKINSSHRITKPAASTSLVNKSTRRSLGSTKDIEHQEKLNQMQKDTTPASSNDGPTRRRGAARAPERQEMPVGQNGNSRMKPPPFKPVRTSKAAARTRQAAPRKSLPEGPKEAPQAVKDATPPQRRQGQTPAKAKPTPRKRIEKERTPGVKGNARVTKSKRATKPPAAPSVHTMRTRARGSAEQIQIT